MFSYFGDTYQKNLTVFIESVKMYIIQTVNSSQSIIEDKENKGGSFSKTAHLILSDGYNDAIRTK